MSKKDASYTLPIIETRTARSQLWKKRWPIHCKSCNGWGFSRDATWVNHNGEAPCDSSQIPEEICNALPSDFCHRCGEATMEPDSDGLYGTLPCLSCGWFRDDGA